jgi:hypothetical protein
MGGRKAGLALTFIVAPSGTAPHPGPPHRKRGEGAANVPPEALQAACLAPSKAQGLPRGGAEPRLR